MRETRVEVRVITSSGKYLWMEGINTDVFPIHNLSGKKNVIRCGGNYQEDLEIEIKVKKTKSKR